MRSRSLSVAISAILIPCASLIVNGQETSQQSRRTPVVEVFEASRDAVVNISSKEIVTVRDPFGSLFDEFFDMPFHRHMRPRERKYTRNSVGSGFVIHPDGYIITNAHVVAQTAERKVAFADGGEFDANIVAIDTDRDLAVLKITADRPLHTLPFGRSEDLMIGETVIAIGNPLGYQNTVTAGVISATGRDLEFGNRMALHDLIQTDASINPGNSGGPLLNVLGELIGVNTAIRGDAQNIGFAIPVDQLREVLPDLLDVERRHRIVCGFTVETVDDPLVISVLVDSPAHKAGIEVGDILKEFNGRAVREGMDFYIALLACKPGESVHVKLLREDQPVEAQLTVGERPAPNGTQLARKKLGIEVEELPPDLAEKLGFPGATGLLIADVEPDGPAGRSNIHPRDILVAIGRHSVSSVDDLGQHLEFVDAGESVPVTILRADRFRKMRMSGQVTAR